MKAKQPPGPTTAGSSPRPGTAAATLVDQLTDPVIVLDEAGQTCYMNPAARRLLNGTGIAQRVIAHVRSHTHPTFVEQVRFRADGRPPIILKLKVSRIQWMGRGARLVAMADVTAYLSTLRRFQRQKAEAEQRLNDLQAERMALAERIRHQEQELKAASARLEQQATELERARQEPAAPPPGTDPIEDGDFEIRISKKFDSPLSEVRFSADAARKRVEEQARRLGAAVAEVHDFAVRLRKACEGLGQKANEHTAKLNLQTRQQALELARLREQLHAETAARKQAEQELEGLQHQYRAAGRRVEELQKTCESLEARAGERAQQLERLKERLQREGRRREEADRENLRLREEIARLRRAQETLNSGLEYFTSLARRLADGVDRFAREHRDHKQEPPRPAAASQAPASSEPPPEPVEIPAERVLIMALEKAEALRHGKPSDARPSPRAPA